MSIKFLLASSMVAALCVGGAHAAETMNQQAAAPQDEDSASQSAGSSSYGGVAGQTASGPMSRGTSGQAADCTPRPFCDIFKGGS
jgi:hypothetical protein